MAVFDFTPYNRTDLVHQTLRELGVLPEGQPVPFELYNSVDRHVNGVIEELRDRRIAWIDSPDVIEQKFFIPLALILADRCKSVFGRAGDQGLKADADDAEGILQQMTQAGPNFDPLEITDF